MHRADPARTLVCGFTGFGRFPVNPAALLAESSARTFKLLEVSYTAADEFVRLLDLGTFDRLVLLGVAGESHHLRLERVAMNCVGALADERGTVLGPGKIDHLAPDALHGTLWSSNAHPTSPDIRFSDDAGDFLCNYLYFRALRHLRTKSVGFLHVPPLGSIDLTGQRSLLHAILRWIESTSVNEDP